MIPIANFEIHARRFLEQELCKFPVLFRNVDRGKREREAKKQQGRGFREGSGESGFVGDGVRVVGLGLVRFCIGEFLSRRRGLKGGVV